MTLCQPMTLCWGMSSRCPFVDRNLIVMRTRQCQQRDSATQNHLLWAGELLRLGPSAQPSFPLTLYVSLTSQLSGRTFHVCFSFTNRVLFSAAPHNNSQINFFQRLNSLSIFIEFRLPFGLWLLTCNYSCNDLWFYLYRFPKPKRHENRFLVRHMGCSYI